MAKEEILIVGTGAMAHLFAARLSLVRHVFVLGTWQEGLAEIEGQGIRVLELDGGESQASVTIVRDAGELSEIRFALVLVKSWQTEGAARSLARCLADDGVALTLQNGLGNLEIMQEFLGEERATLGVTTTGATLIKPGLVRHGGDGPITLGPHAHNEPFAELLTQAGFDVQRQDDLEALIWSKLAVNAAINPLTALLEVRNGQLLTQEATRELMRSAADEVGRLAQVMGIDLSMDDPAAFAYKVAEHTSDNVSSMLQDIQRGAPTEIDAICGAIARIAMQHDVDTPTNWGFWNLVRAKVHLRDGE